MIVGLRGTCATCGSAEVGLKYHKGVQPRWAPGEIPPTAYELCWHTTNDRKVIICPGSGNHPSSVAMVSNLIGISQDNTVELVPECKVIGSLPTHFKKWGT